MGACAAGDWVRRQAVVRADGAGDGRGRGDAAARGRVPCASLYHYSLLHPQQRDHRGPGPGGLGDRRLPACPARRGRPQHGHPRQRRRVLPAPLQLLRRRPLGGLAQRRHRPAAGPPHLLPAGDPALDARQPRPLRRPGALHLQRHLPARVTRPGAAGGPGTLCRAGPGVAAGDTEAWATPRRAVPHPGLSKGDATSSGPVSAWAVWQPRHRRRHRSRRAAVTLLNYATVRGCFALPPPLPLAFSPPGATAHVGWVPAVPPSPWHRPGSRGGTALPWPRPAAQPHTEPGCLSGLLGRGATGGTYRGRRHAGLCETAGRAHAAPGYGTTARTRHTLPGAGGRAGGWVGERVGGQQPHSPWPCPRPFPARATPSLCAGWLRRLGQCWGGCAPPSHQLGGGGWGDVGGTGGWRGGAPRTHSTVGRPAAR
ncbi:uncharacterized protein LOC142054061 [Phalacrocorax aristotelis]|uniref:uncharacterized protein LOC142054061 n=1 Tax=Phalacrocorax aristotelis TaxID=126867 RepID=UPI003F4C059A